MKRWITMFAVLSISLAGSWARGHGEDKAGPHGGEIRMPGAFHTELRAAGAGKIEIFLLDFEWRNPLVEGSSVKASIEGGAGLTCAPMKDRFDCALAAGRAFAAGDVIVVQAARAGQEGVPVRYPFPFRHASDAGGDEPHGR